MLRNTLALHKTVNLSQVIMDEYGLGKVTREEARFQMVSVPANVVLSTCSKYSSRMSLKC